jgi:hypothetical protein
MPTLNSAVISATLASRSVTNLKERVKLIFRPLKVGLVLSCLILSCHVISCLFLSCLVLACRVLSYLVMLCHVFSCLVLSCHGA